MKIILVEDEPRVADFVSKALTEFGYNITWASTGSEGLEKIQSGQYDLVILDIMLPDIDGFSILEKIRIDGVSVPVLMLSAKGAVPDRVKGLDLGADDYLAKPFELNELIARVRALMRRRPNDLSWLTVGDLTLDPVSRKVLRGGKRIDLTAREFALLEYLLRNRGRVLSRTQIMDTVWNDPNGETNVVPVYINYLRSKIEKEGSMRLLHTIRGVGYLLELRD